jgi:hypothetical protein
MKRFNNYTVTTLFIVLLLLIQIFFLSCTEIIEPEFPKPDQLLLIKVNEEMNIGTVEGYSYSITLTNIFIDIYASRIYHDGIDTRENNSSITIKTNAGEYTFSVSQNQYIDLLFDNYRTLIIKIIAIRENEIEAFIYYNPEMM